jgi:hypothetical protein
MELLTQHRANTAADQEQRMMVFTTLYATESSSTSSLIGVVQGLGRRRTRISIDSQVLFCLTQIILRMMQQIPLRNFGTVFG